MKTNFEGKEFTLTQEAYYNAGSGMYEAHAADESGKEYMAYFEIIDGHEDDEKEGKIMEVFVNPHKEIENLYKSLKQWDKGRKNGQTFDTSWRVQIGYGHEIVVGMTYHEADGYNEAFVDGDVYFISRRERIKPCPADEAVDVFTNEAIKIYNEQLERKKQGKIYF